MLSKILTVNLLHIFVTFVCLLCITAAGFLIQIVPPNSALQSFVTQLSCQGQQQTLSRPLDINVENYHHATLLRGRLCANEDILNTFSDITITWQTLPQLKLSNNIYPYDALFISSPYQQVILAKLFPNYIISAVSAPVPLALYHAGNVSAVTTETLWASKIGVLSSHWSVEHPFFTLALRRWGVMPEHLDIVTVDSQQALETRLYNGEITFMLAANDLAIKPNFNAITLNINAPTPLLLIHKKHTNTVHFCQLAKHLAMPWDYQGMAKISECEV